MADPGRIPFSGGSSASGVADCELADRSPAIVSPQRRRALQFGSMI
jgi:hypothetical protein